MDLGAFFASAAAAVFLAIAFALLGCYVFFRVLYSVIWRAVRRGLREYHGAAGLRAMYPLQRSDQPGRVNKRSEHRAPPPIRSEPGPRDWSPKGGTLFE